MKMYEVEFFKVHKQLGNYYYVINDSDYKEIDLGKLDVLIAKESDLDKLKEYGNGIKSLKYIGNLFESDEIDSIGIVIKAEVEGLEEANSLAKELQNTLDNLEIKFKI